MGTIGSYCDKTAMKLNNESRNLISIVILPKDYFLVCITPGFPYITLPQFYDPIQEGMSKNNATTKKKGREYIRQIICSNQEHLPTKLPLILTI